MASVWNMTKYLFMSFECMFEEIQTLRTLCRLAMYNCSVKGKKLQRPFEIQKNGVFLFEISFFVSEILSFLYYAN